MLFLDILCIVGLSLMAIANIIAIYQMYCKDQDKEKMKRKRLGFNKYRKLLKRRGL